MTDYDATNRRHIRIAEKSAKLAEDQRREAVGGIMSNPYGRAWMWDILIRCHVFAPSFTESPYRTAFAEGERNVGLQFVNDIMAHCPDLYVKMAQEAQERELTDAARRTHADARDGAEPDQSGDAEAVGVDEARDNAY